MLAGGRHFVASAPTRAPRRSSTGAGPAAIGAIVGSAVPLALSLGVWWQAVVLGAGGLALLRRWPPLVVIVLGGVVGLALVG